MNDFRGTINVSAVLGAGVYILSHWGEIVYIGKSKCLLNRLYVHSNKSKLNQTKTPWTDAPAIKFDDVEIIPCAVARLDRLEQALIKMHNPKYNVKHKLNVKDILDVVMTDLPPPTPPPRMFKCRPLA